MQKLRQFLAAEREFDDLRVDEHYTYGTMIRPDQSRMSLQGVIQPPDRLASDRSPQADGNCPLVTEHLVETFLREVCSMQTEKQTAYTIAEFCEKYAIHRSTFYRNLKRGLMPPVIKLGPATRILAEDERTWLSAQKAPS